MSPELIISLLTFGLLAAGLMALFTYLDRRYRRYLVARWLPPREQQPDQSRAIRSWYRTALKLGRLALPKEERRRKPVRRQLTLAGYRGEQALIRYYGLRLLLALGLGFIYLVVSGLSGHWDARHLVMAFLPMGLGYYLPSLWLRYAIKSRQRRIFLELPDVLDLLLICIEAGLSFDMALDRVSRELKGIAPVLSAEFSQFFFEIKSGLPRREVMHNLAQRNDESSLTSVVNVLLQSNKFGTDVAEALRVYIRSTRTQRRQMAEEKGAKISVRLLFPMIMLIMPALIIVVLGPAGINILERVRDGF